MGQWQIYKKDGKPLYAGKGMRSYEPDGNVSSEEGPQPVAVHSLSYNGKLMGEEYVTVTVSSPVVIEWQIGDYIEYRGRRFVMSVTPSVQKQARVKTVGNAIVYDSVRFVSYAGDEMTRCEFRDVVISNTIHTNFSARQFTFNCVSLLDFADRVKANMDEFANAGNTPKWRVFTYCEEKGKDGSVTQYYYESLNAGDQSTEGQEAPDGSGRKIRNAAKSDHAVGKKNVNVSINSEKVWDALKNVKDVFDVNFVVVNRTIYLGANGNILGQHFSYGKSDDGESIDATHGLFKFERTTDSQQAVVTRLRAYGSEKNMQPRYYQNLKYHVFMNLDNCTFESTEAEDMSIIYIKVPAEDAKKYKFVNSLENGSYSLVAKLGGIKASFTYSVGNFGEGEDTGVVLFITGEDGNTEDMYHGLIEALMSPVSKRLYIENGADVSKWPTGYKEANASYDIPNNMAVHNLMLPGFGFKGNSLLQEVTKVYERRNEADKTLIDRLGCPTLEILLSKYGFSDSHRDPYITAVPQLDLYGVREESVTFDGSSDNDDIHPSIEYVMGLDKDGKTLAVIVDAKNPEDDGYIDDDNLNNADYINFELTIPDIGFNIYDHLSANNATLSMIDGMCGGKEFEIVSRPKQNADGTWTFKCKRAQESSLDIYFPSADFPIKAGDRFVLLNLELPNEYVDRTALYALLPVAIEFIDKNRDVRYKYSLTVDNIHLARQHDASVAGGSYDESVYWNIKAGDLVLFGDEDLGVNYDENEKDKITGSILIDSLEIKEGENRIPQVTIQLVDEVSVGTLQAIQKQIDGIVKGTITVGSAANSGNGGYSAGDIQRMIRTYGSRWYLSKESDDRASGNITFEKDVTVNGAAKFGSSFAAGSSGARIWQQDGSWHAQFDFLHITKKATFSELEIQKMSHIGGAFILSAASCTIDHVDPVAFTYVDGGEELTLDAVRCYFAATDGEKSISNDWMVGDQVICKTFNLEIANEEGGPAFEGKDAANHYWWRRIVSVGTTEDGQYHYFDVIAEQTGIRENVDYDHGSDLPLAGDDCMLLGHQPTDAKDRIDKARRGNAIIIDSAGEGSPYIRTYKRIGFDLTKPYDLDHCLRLNLEADNPTLLVNSFQIAAIGSDGEEYIKDVGAALIDGFEIYSLDIEAPTEDVDGVNAPLSSVALGTPSWPDAEESWPEEELDSHATPGDVAITTDGVYYRFTKTFDGSYQWQLITDTYLIQAIQQAQEAQAAAAEAMVQAAEAQATLDAIADDNIITEQEKPALRERLNEFTQRYNAIIDEASQAYVYAVETLTEDYEYLTKLLNYILDTPGDIPLVREDGLMLVVRKVSFSGGTLIPSAGLQLEVVYGTFEYGMLTTRDYDFTIAKFLNSLEDLRAAITAAMFERIDQIAIEGGYDAKILEDINTVKTEVSKLFAKTQKFESDITRFENDLSVVSNWKQKHDTMTGSGFITRDDYASLFSTVSFKDKYGNDQTVEAIANTYVAHDGNGWISGFNIAATLFTCDTQNFKVNDKGDVTIYGHLIQKPFFVSKDNFLEVMTVFEEYNIDVDGEKLHGISYDYDFISHSTCVVFTGDLSDFVYMKTNDISDVYIQMPGVKSEIDIERKLAVINMVGSRIMIVNNSNKDIGANLNGASKPIISGHYIVIVLESVIESKKTIYRWSVEEEDSISNIEFRSS